MPELLQNSRTGHSSQCQYDRTVDYYLVKISRTSRLFAIHLLVAMLTLMTKFENSFLNAWADKYEFAVIDLADKCRNKYMTRLLYSRDVVR